MRSPRPSCLRLPALSLLSRGRVGGRAAWVVVAAAAEHGQDHRPEVREVGAPLGTDRDKRLGLRQPPNLRHWARHRVALVAHDQHARRAVDGRRRHGGGFVSRRRLLSGGRACPGRRRRGPALVAPTVALPPRGAGAHLATLLRTRLRTRLRTSGDRARCRRRRHLLCGCGRRPRRLGGL